MTSLYLLSTWPESTPYSNRPVENVTLNFGKIEWKYTLQEEDGIQAEVVEGSYDVIGNRAR